MQFLRFIYLFHVCFELKNNKSVVFSFVELLYIFISMAKYNLLSYLCHVILAKANNKYIKEYDKNEESSYIRYWDVNNSSGWAMPQKPPVIDFQLIEDTSQFNEDCIKSYNDESDEGYFLKFFKFLSI